MEAINMLPIKYQQNDVTLKRNNNDIWEMPRSSVAIQICDPQRPKRVKRNNSNRLYLIGPVGPVEPKGILINVYT
jgi:hypothetical protein